MTSQSFANVLLIFFIQVTEDANVFGKLSYTIIFGLNFLWRVLLHPLGENNLELLNILIGLLAQL